jgi:hypothetical protein
MARDATFEECSGEGQHCSQLFCSRRESNARAAEQSRLPDRILVGCRAGVKEKEAPAEIAGDFGRRRLGLTVVAHSEIYLPPTRLVDVPVGEQTRTLDLITGKITWPERESSRAVRVASTGEGELIEVGAQRTSVLIFCDRDTGATRVLAQSPDYLVGPTFSAGNAAVWAGLLIDLHAGRVVGRSEPRVRALKADGRMLIRLGDPASIDMTPAQYRWIGGF